MRRVCVYEHGYVCPFIAFAFSRTCENGIFFHTAMVTLGNDVDVFVFANELPSKCFVRRAFIRFLSSD